MQQGEAVLFWMYDEKYGTVFQVKCWESMNKGWWIVEGDPFDACVQVGNGIYNTKEEAARHCLGELREEKARIEGLIANLEMEIGN